MVVVKVLGPVAILSRFSVALSGPAHLGIRKAEGAVPAAVGLALLAASFATQNTARRPPSPYAWGAAEHPSTLTERR